MIILEQLSDYELQAIIMSVTVLNILVLSFVSYLLYKILKEK